MQRIFKQNLELNKGGSKMLNSLGLIGIIIFFAILYYVIRVAVEHGVFNALKRYDKYKENNTYNEE